MNTDVAIIGGGIGGLMAAYRITKNRPDISVVIYDSGHMIEKRRCPASKNNGCVHCKICSITCGFAGAGAFSDGKFNLGTAYGGTLGESLGDGALQGIIIRSCSCQTRVCALSVFSTICGCLI